MYYVYFSFQKHKISELSYFPSMSVTYQDNYHVKFSVNACDTLGQRYHPNF